MIQPLVALMLVGCSKGADGPDCGTLLPAAFKEAASSVAKLPTGERAKTDEALRVLGDAFVSSCHSQHWSAPAITCIAKGKTDEELKTCATQLTDPQKQSLTTDVANALSGEDTSVTSFGAPPYSQAALDSLDDAIAGLHDATNGLAAARLPTDSRTTAIEDAIKRARQRALLNEPEDPEMPFADAVRRARRLALRYRVETALPAMILTRDASAVGP